MTDGAGEGDNAATPKANGGGVSRWGRGRRIAFVCLIVVVVLLAVGFGWFILGRYSGGAQLEKALAEVRAAGLPTSYTDAWFDPWREESLDASVQAATADYRKAAGLYVNPYDTAEFQSNLPILELDTWRCRPPEPIDEETLASLRKRNALQGEAPAILVRASKTGIWKHLLGEAFWSADEEELDISWKLVEMLVIKALVDAEDGRQDDAVDAVLAALAIGDGLAQCPSFLTINAATYCYIIIATGEGLEQFVASMDLSDENLTRMQGALLASDGRISLSTLLASEAAFCTVVYKSITDGESRALISIEDSENRFAEIRYARHLEWLMRGQYEVEGAFVLRAIAEYARELSESGGVEYRAGEWEKTRSEAKMARYLTAVRQISKIEMRVGMVARVHAQLRSTAVCMAAQRYRNEHGEWPESLDKLVPAYMDALPVDPFTGKPLVYKKAANGVKVYSVGRNLKDDDGKPYLELWPDGATGMEVHQYDDVGFRVWK